MSAASWYNPAWRYRCKLTIPAAQLTGALTNHPVYVPGSVLPASVFTGALANGYDLLFTSSDGTTKLAHERVHWVPGSSGAELHFKAPVLSNLVANEFFLYWGYPALTTDQQSAAAVWSNGYVGVWHLGESAAGTGTAGVYLDSLGTGNGDDYVDPGGKAGKLFSTGGETFDGGDYVLVPDNPLDIGTNDVSITAWIKHAATAVPRNIFAKGAAGAAGYLFRIASTKVLQFGIQVGASLLVDGSSAVDTNAWVHAAVTADRDGNATFYVNGAPDGTASIAAQAGNASNAVQPRIGMHSAGVSGFAGIIDEVRVSTGVRSAPWIAADYANQNAPATFLTVGAVESSSSPLHRLGAYGRYRR